MRQRWDANQGYTHMEWRAPYSRSPIDNATKKLFLRGMLPAQPMPSRNAHPTAPENRRALPSISAWRTYFGTLEEVYDERFSRQYGFFRAPMSET
jgi:hypothetical protein